MGLLGCGDGKPAQDGAGARRWLDPVPLETYGETAISPALSLDARGDALVLWQQHGIEAGLWSNRFVSGRWTGAESVQPGEGVGYEPQVATNESGVAFGLWSTIDPSVGWRRLRAARRLPGASWEPPVAVDRDAGLGDAVGGQIVVFDDGGAAAVWHNYGRVLSNRFDARTGWGSPEVLSSDIDAFPPLLRMNGAANVLVLWFARGNWVARRLDPSSGWGPEERLTETRLGDPEIAIRPSGEAVVLWHRLEPGTSAPFDYSGILANRFVPGSGWTPLVPLAEETRLACRTGLAADATGNAVAVWGCRVDPFADRWGAWYSRLPVAGEWAAARRLTSLPEGARFRMLAGDEAGNAFGLWTEGATGSTLLRGARFGATSGWGPLEPMDGPGELSPLYVGAGRAGDGLAVWVDGPFGPGTQRIRSAQYAEGAWRQPEEVSGAGDVGAFRMAFTPSGDALAVWQQGVGGSMWSIWSNRYVSR
jgi:hypothetical protein